MKLPFIQFFPSDYQRDTRALSLAAKGGWMDVLCMLHGSSTRGTMTLPVVGWARIMGATVDQAEAVIGELEIMVVADVTREGNGNVTLSCRRMLRDGITREQTRLRVARHRCNAASNANCNAVETGQKTEGRSQKVETNNQPADLCAEAPAPPAPEGLGELPLGSMIEPVDPIILVFPTVGEPNHWHLRQSKIEQYKTTFVGVNVDAACREARQWCIDNEKSRKTAKGMPKFLFGWLERRQNGNRGGGAGGGGQQPRGPSWR